MTPTGTFTRKIGRQDSPPMSAVSSNPPKSCPTVAATPPVAAYRPRARPRPGPSSVAWNVASTWGWMSAAVSAWATRAATSQPALGAIPQSRDVRVKPASPIRNSRRRPRASPNRPPTTSISAKAVP